MKDLFRLQEYKVLFYRLFLAYVFYFFARILFTLLNYELLVGPDFVEFVALQYHGLKFDTTAILYVNLLVFLLSALPLVINTKKVFQKVLMYIYFSFNLTAFATNFVDFIYFRYILSRSTMSSLESIENEGNKLILLGSFLQSYWYMFLLFIVLSWGWIYLYKLVRIKESIPKKSISYFSLSTVLLLFFSLLIVGGIRGGDFKRSTRPINNVDANRYVTNNLHANIVLNTPFSIIRSINKKSISKVSFLSDEKVEKLAKPIKQYDSQNKTKPNIVILIVESLAREYLGAFNPDTKIKDYKGHSPFIDSLAQHSLIFTNAYANGYKSIHGMSSVLSGIPSFKTAFTSSPYTNQKIESLVSILESEGYNSSFFHGAENGSMGFLGYSNILGIDSYFGREEFNNDKEFDGFWGIWDEPFLQFMKTNLDDMKEPFFSTIFTLSSHNPFVIPERYKDKFPEGDIKMHKNVSYTDYALKRFFNEAKKEPWFDNTIFVMVADHGSTGHYKEYKQPLNFQTLPILFYSSNNKYVGVNSDLAQQIDIYPTLIDMIGYDKPFRSWGRSLISDKEEPFVINFISGLYHLHFKNYVCVFDGVNVVGFYKFDDKSMKTNLIDKKSELFLEMELKCKSLVQSYMNRIVDGELTSDSLN